MSEHNTCSTVTATVVTRQLAACTKNAARLLGSPLRYWCSSVQARLRPQWPRLPALRAPLANPPGGAVWEQLAAGHAEPEGTAG